MRDEGAERWERREEMRAQERKKAEHTNRLQGAQRAERREQRAESRDQRSESRKQRAESKLYCISPLTRASDKYGTDIPQRADMMRQLDT
jgi:hypothetical protein